MPPPTAPGAQTAPAATIAESVSDQARLLAALSNPALFGSGCRRVERLETHISCVFLTGAHAYKIKKAVDFGFLDFTTLAARRFFCAEELRLNRRLAPALYLDVVPITGSVDEPVVGGEGPALEYAVKMREFPQDALASRILARGEFSGADIDALAAQVATFHGAIRIAPRGSTFGLPEQTLRLARQNFAQIDPLLAGAAERDEIEVLHAWTERENALRRGAFLHRYENGFIRECHGDLHLGNIARIEGELTIFDCIEFSPAMRWIDVMSEVAFTVMDLEDRGRADLAYRFLNAYLESTGDYGGLAVLRFYLVYRALVRAKIALLRASQIGPGDARYALRAEYRGYLNLAQNYARSARPGLVITHGFAGCGKTTASQALLEAIGAVRIRSDVERKRLHGLTALERRDGGIEQDLYAPAATNATYARLRALTEDALRAGWSVIVDATFLKRSERDPFRTLAAELGVALVILDFRANEATLRGRILQRRARGADASDADLAVLANQIATSEPLAAHEKVFALAHDAEAPLEAKSAAATWESIRARLESS